MMKNTVIAVAAIALAMSTASGDWVPASLSDGVFEGFDGAMAEDDTTVPIFSGESFFEDTYWQVTQAGMDVSMSLGGPGSFPSDGGYNMGTTQAVHGLNDRALGTYAAGSSPRPGTDRKRSSRSQPVLRDAAVERSQSSAGRHLHQFRVEPDDDVDQVGLFDAELQYRFDHRPAGSSTV